MSLFKWMVEQRKVVFANRQTLMRVTKGRSSCGAIIAHMLKKKICKPVCAKFCQSLSSADLMIFLWRYTCPSNYPVASCLSKVLVELTVFLSVWLSVHQSKALAIFSAVCLSVDFFPCRHIFSSNYLSTCCPNYLLVDTTIFLPGYPRDCHLHWADISRSRKSLIIHISIASNTAILGGQLRTSSLNTALLAIIRPNYYLLILFYFIFAASFLRFYLFARIFFWFFGTCLFV